ncbi:ABC transporter ATP-binding protein [Halioxenophilus aromaticivorans]|uniref:ABC transporter ATP-binding protein n=1 Tax=Halioxenophilus aromaticivorans TaxID=1306992 RepID=A0AAV3U8Y5_9ALTE
MLIGISDLIYRYHKNSQPILDIPTWQVEAGERVFLHGPSGSGKTTLLNLLAGILVCNQKHNPGTLEVLGQPLHRLRPGQRDRWRAQHIGVVFQQFNLIPYLNALQNIQLGAHFGKGKDTKSHSHELLETLGINASLAEKKCSQLSIGQQQRVAIARSLINRPELLIVDEPTSALDAENRAAFMQLLLRQVEKHNTTLLFVSHDLSLSEGMTRVEALSDFNRAGARQ